MSALPLFPDLPETEPVPSLSRARQLVADVEDLENIVDDTFVDSCLRVARRAKLMGAHSVARVCAWLADFRTLDRHGYDHMHSYANKCAARWLRRQELRP